MVILEEVHLGSYDREPIKPAIFTRHPWYSHEVSARCPSKRADSARIENASPPHTIKSSKFGVGDHVLI
ncbi:hypothetical protein NC651_015251 [Populus alba x Populus x berolinensis]|nr:hypothetical protein NC651_015251 [Populus alba x Populus x berolinensis]